MNSIVRYVGLDVHKREVEVCVIDGAGEIVLRKRVACLRPALEELIRTHLQATDQVALEATTNCWAVAKVFQPHVARRGQQPAGHQGDRLGKGQDR